MKETINYNPNPIKYPYLGIHNDGTIVYFVRSNYGICLSPARLSIKGDIGTYPEACFSSFQGTLTLEND